MKQSRPNYPFPPVIIPRYTPDEDTCPLLRLEEYIERTKELRQDNVLFISTIKPHNPVGAQTMSRWIKTLFKPYSTRHAASAAAFQVSIDFLWMIFRRRQVGAVLRPLEGFFFSGMS